MTYAFISMTKTRSAEVKVHNEDINWMDLSEEFFSFLQACGYVLTREDFAAYWEQYLEYNTPYEEVEDPDQDPFEFGLGDDFIAAGGGTMAAQDIDIGTIEISTGQEDFGFGSTSVGSVARK